MQITFKIKQKDECGIILKQGTIRCRINVSENIFVLESRKRGKILVLIFKRILLIPGIITIKSRISNQKIFKGHPKQILDE